MLWSRLKQGLYDVQKELQDCKGAEDWGEQCQIVLRSLAGWHFLDFAHFVFHLTRVQLAARDQSLCQHDVGHSRGPDESYRLLSCFSLVQLGRVVEELLQFSVVSDQLNQPSGKFCHEVDTLTRLREACAQTEAECASICRLKTIPP